ncbi:hypothetical protein EPUL_001047 [Erysiphe pulchra]|uniref:Integral membrane protein n=1 Tax=Erysiphe pulchra TaxID=225359 RepID=A0A2S4PXY2_9PEZI|nr:hypothetical protein EPUL_001047 [Erysiphe pulchra]
MRRDATQFPGNPGGRVPSQRHPGIMLLLTKECYRDQSVNKPSQLSKFISAFIGAWLGLKLLQSKKTPEFTQDVTVETSGRCVDKKISLAGRTIDLTLFAITRASDVVVGSLWSRRKIRRRKTGQWNRFDELISRLADPILFSASSAIIMFNWLYTPEKLPRSYNKWVRSAAAVDMRLISGLRQLRNKGLIYGVEPSYPHVFTDMCQDYNWPLEWANHAKTVPVPCEIVHLKDGPSCEYHALARLVRSTAWAMSTYLPLNLVLVLRQPSSKALKRAVKSAMRSSLFLGTYIALFYYGICLVRSRIGPIVLGTSNASRQFIDSGMNVAGGCVLCGWSVLIENSGRRRELALFLIPKALATLFPRSYSIDQQWRERMAFSISTAIVFTAVSEKSDTVRGLMGRVLKTVLI